MSANLDDVAALNGDVGRISIFYFLQIDRHDGFGSGPIRADHFDCAGIGRIKLAARRNNCPSHSEARGHWIGAGFLDPSLDQYLAAPRHHNPVAGTHLQRQILMIAAIR